MEFKGRVCVFSITGCPHCLTAKSTLKDKMIPYIDINMDTYPELLDDLNARTGKLSVPQIFFNNIFVGGNGELQKAIGNPTEWKRLMDEITNNEPAPEAPQPPSLDSEVVQGKDGGIVVAKKESEKAAKAEAPAKEDLTSRRLVCEPDEYAALVAELKGSGVIKDNKSGLSTVKDSFKGKEFVEWLVKKKKLDKSTAIQMGQMLIDKHFGHNVKAEEVFKDDDTLYRLLEDEESTALNGGSVSKCEPMPANELGENLRRLILKIYGNFLSPDGKGVDYKGISGSPDFQEYVTMTGQLTRVILDKSDKEEKIAFFINIYNALVIHANVVKGHPTNLWQRYKFFNTVRYIIGGNQYSLQDIENGILRGNQKGVGQLTKPFGKSDPRLKVALNAPEPKIHFALVCGAKSCPPIKTYTAKGIDDQLKLAAASFLEGDDGCTIDMAKKEIKLSQIFSWYQTDFGGKPQLVLDFVYNHMSKGEKKDQLKTLLDGKKWKLSHLNYDWSVNEKK